MDAIALDCSRPFVRTHLPDQRATIARCATALAFVAIAGGTVIRLRMMMSSTARPSAPLPHQSVSSLEDDIQREWYAAYCAYFDLSLKEARHRMSSPSSCSLTAIFTQGQTTSLGIISLPSRSQTLALDERTVIKLQELSTLWKGLISLIGFEFEEITSCGWFGSDQRNDCYRYDLQNRKVDLTTSYIR